jgi:hypothetical protein
MNGVPQEVRGISAPHTSFIITVDSPPRDFIAMYGTPFNAVGDERVVEVTFIPGGTPGPSPFG